MNELELNTQREEVINNDDNKALIDQNKGEVENAESGE